MSGFFGSGEEEEETGQVKTTTKLAVLTKIQPLFVRPSREHFWSSEKVDSDDCCQCSQQSCYFYGGADFKRSLLEVLPSL